MSVHWGFWFRSRSAFSNSAKLIVPDCIRRLALIWFELVRIAYYQSSLGFSKLLRFQSFNFFSTFKASFRISVLIFPDFLLQFIIKQRRSLSFENSVIASASSDLPDYWIDILYLNKINYISNLRYIANFSKYREKNFRQNL